MSEYNVQIPISEEFFFKLTYGEASDPTEYRITVPANKSVVIRLTSEVNDLEPIAPETVESIEEVVIEIVEITDSVDLDSIDIEDDQSEAGEVESVEPETISSEDEDIEAEDSEVETSDDEIETDEETEEIEAEDESTEIDEDEIESINDNAIAQPDPLVPEVIADATVAETLVIEPVAVALVEPLQETVNQPLAPTDSVSTIVEPVTLPAAVADPVLEATAAILNPVVDPVLPASVVAENVVVAEPVVIPTVVLVPEPAVTVWHYPLTKRSFTHELFVLMLHSQGTAAIKIKLVET